MERAKSQSKNHQAFVDRRKSKELSGQRRTVVSWMQSLEQSKQQLLSAYKLLDKYQEADCPNEQIYYLWQRVCANKRKSIEQYKKHNLATMQAIANCKNKVEKFKPKESSSLVPLNQLQRELRELDVSELKKISKRHLHFVQKVTEE
jgi:hypothetical protein